AQDVIGGADFSVGAGADDGLDGLNDFVRADASEAEWVVTRSVVIGAGDAIRAGRQDECGLNLVDAQARTAGRAILGENLDGEELVEKADVARNDHERGDGRNGEGEVLLVDFGALEIDAGDLDVQAAAF